MKTYPVRPKHITNVAHAFGPLIAGLEGTTTRRASARVHFVGKSVPDDCYHLQRFVTLAADVIFVNRVSFLVTLARRIKLYTVEHIPNWAGPVLSNSLKNILNVYTGEDYTVKVILMDMKFETNHDEIDMAIVNTTGEREHVTDRRRGIQTIKENAECTVFELRRVEIKVLPKTGHHTPTIFHVRVD